MFSKGYQPYDWKTRIDAGDTWYTLKSVEAQARFIEDVFADGYFDFDTPGAFFKENPELGHNVFEAGGTPYTEQANAAWRIIRTG